MRARRNTYTSILATVISQSTFTMNDPHSPTPPHIRRQREPDSGEQQPGQVPCSKTYFTLPGFKSHRLERDQSVTAALKELLSANGHIIWSRYNKKID